MSREIRRVPLGWQHPTEPNPYWREQQAHRVRSGRPPYKLVQEDERFVGLLGDLNWALDYFRTEVTEILAGVGFSWRYALAHHLTGVWEGEAVEVRPFQHYDRDGETLVEVTVLGETHLRALLLAHEVAAPDPAAYMPTFEDLDPDTLGWALYQTVGEGSPITPTFATADELIEHLVAEGDDWTQEPWRQASAEAMVRTGSSFGSMVVVNGQVLDGARDLDKLAGEAS